MTKILFAVAAGLIVGVVASYYLLGPADNSGPDSSKKPLYWVAPMDPGFRRDRPGKSPMGMDLLPVYDTPMAAKAPAGTITVAANVVNNLGVRTATATLQTLRPAIKTVGYVQYNQDRLIHIHPRVEGWVDTLHVKAAGDPVAAGQPLYTLYSPQLVNVQEEFLLALKRDNQRLIEAAEDRLRALKLSADFIETLKRRRQVQQSITFFASRAGVIDTLNIREGFYVQPGTTLMSIGNLDEVWVEAEVFERQVAQVRVGQSVTMSLDFLPARHWLGQVDYVYPALDEVTRTVRVRLRFDNADGRLKPNMFADVIIHGDSDTASLVIPREALIRTGSEDRVVLALGQGQFRSVVVRAGQITPQAVEILSGLRAGDSIVTSAQFLLDSESSKAADLRRMQPVARRAGGEP